MIYGSLEKNEIYLLTNNLRAYRKIVPVMAFLVQITACILLDFASGWWRHSLQAALLPVGNLQIGILQISNLQIIIMP